jgi:hypothetical protein
MKKWISIILNFWGAISILIVIGVIFILSFEKPLPVSFSSLFISIGILISGVICGKNVIDLITEPNYNGSETTLTMGIDLANEDDNGTIYINGVRNREYQPKEDVNDIKNPPQGDK